MFDDFQTTMTCPLCGHTSGPSESIGMQTKLRGNRDSSTLRVGYEFEANDLRTSHIKSSGYLVIREPSSRSEVLLLNTWTCPSCDKEQWAVVEIADGKLASIRPVQMSASTFDRAHFIDGVDAELLAAAVLRISPLAVIEQQLDPVEVLRQHLPA